MVLVAHPHATGREDDAPIREVGRLHVVVGAVGQLPQAGAVHAHLVDMPPWVRVAAATAEEHALAVPRHLAVRDVAVVKMRQRVRLRLRRSQVQAVKIVAETVRRPAVRGRVCLPPGIDLEVVGHFVRAFDEYEGTRLLLRVLQRVRRRRRRGLWPRLGAKTAAAQRLARHHADAVVRVLRLGIAQRRKRLLRTEFVERNGRCVLDVQDVPVVFE